MSPLPLTNDPSDHALGLIYCDHASGPRTHALIIGVGTYPWSDLPELSSPPASARAIADWFLGFGETRFRNAARPLGSLALLLSDPQDNAADKQKAREAAAAGPCRYRGIPTLRPTFKNLVAAVEAWASRLDDPQSMAMVYICGHGLSDAERSAFVLEDYGRDPQRPFRGLGDARLFIKAAATYPARAQMLFFDFCRSEAGLGLPAGATFAPVLEFGGRRNPDAGQLAMFSTLPGENAFGQTGTSSLFATSLLWALDLGATGWTGRWIVRPGAFYEVISQCLALYGGSDNAIQRADSTLAAANFDINFPSYTNEVRTFISLSDPEEWRAAKIEIANLDDGAAIPITIRGEDTPAPFYIGSLPAGRRFRFSSTVNGVRREKDQAIGAPVQFALIDGEESPATITVYPIDRGLPAAMPQDQKSLKGRGSPDSGEVETPQADDPLLASIDIAIAGAMRTEGVVAKIGPLSAEPARITEQFVLPVGGEASAVQTEGVYRIDIRLPDGRSMVRDVTLSPEVGQRIEFNIDSAVGGLAAARTSGVIRPGTWTTDSTTATAFAMPTIEAIAQPAFSEIEGARPCIVTDIRFSEIDPTGGDPRFASVSASGGPALRYRPDDETPLIDRQRNASTASAPLWAHIALGDRGNICFVPSLGSPGPDRSWAATVAIDRSGPLQAHIAAGVVGSTWFTGLSGHLARRNFELAESVLTAVTALGSDPFQQTYNPIAQVAAGLILAATAPPDPAPFDKQIERLARRYPSLPDGAVLLARRHWSLARSEEDEDHTRELFLEAFRRGVPVFSLSLNWLALGLDALGAKDEATLVAAMERRCDPSQCFTSIRLA